VAETPDGRSRLIEALEVRAHLRQGVVIGLAMGVAAYLLFVAGAGSLTTRVLYLSLTVVLALTTTAVVTTVLVGAEAYKLAAEDGPTEP